jgi:hypothetical protein
MTTTHRIGTSVALALVLAAGATPAGARSFDLNANGSYVPSGSASVQAESQPAGTPMSTGPGSDVTSINGYDFARVPPTGVPPILAAAKRSQRAALQQAQQQRRLAYLAHHEPNSAQYSSAEMNAYAHHIPIGIPSTVVHVVSHDGGFDWGDAGIGAAGGLGLALVGVGGAFAISQQRQTRRSKGSAAITS